MTVARSIFAGVLLLTLVYWASAWVTFSADSRMHSQAAGMLELHREISTLASGLANWRTALMTDPQARPQSLDALIDGIGQKLKAHEASAATHNSWSAWRERYADALAAAPEPGTSGIARMRPFIKVSLINEQLAEVASSLRFDFLRQWQPDNDTELVFELTLASALSVNDLAAQVEALLRLPDLPTPLRSRLGVLRVEVDKIARYYQLFDLTELGVAPPSWLAVEAELDRLTDAFVAGETLAAADGLALIQDARSFGDETLTYADAIFAAFTARSRADFIFVTMACLLLGVLNPLLLFAYERQRLASDVTRNQLGNALAGLDVGSWTRDLITGRIVWSPELRRIFGYGPEVPETTLRPLVHEDDADEVERRLSVLLTAPVQDPPVRQQFDVRFKHPSGEPRWVSCVVAKTRLANGNPGLVGVLIDTHERHMTEDRLSNTLDALARRNEEMHFFTRSTAHDLMEPIRVAHSFAEILAEESGAELSPDAKESLGYVLEATERAKQTLQCLREYLALSNLGEPVPVDLNAIVAETLDRLAERIKDTGAQIEQCPLPEVMGHRVAMQTLFDNVISNAIHFTERHAAPEVRMRAQADDAYLHLIVADKGIGVEEGYLEDVFKPFKRLHPRKDFAGVGMGLALCRRAAEFAGGEIWLESAGQGTEVHIKLPLVTQATTIGVVSAG